MKHATLISLFALLLGLFVSCSNKDELIPVAIEGKWGYINNKGEYVITPRFYSAEYFHEDLACVKTVDGNVGYIDARANFVVKPEYYIELAGNRGLAHILRHRRRVFLRFRRSLLTRSDRMTKRKSCIRAPMRGASALAAIVLTVLAGAVFAPCLAAQSAPVEYAPLVFA